MKKHTKRPDGFRCNPSSNSDHKKRMKWLYSLKPGDKVETCSYTIEEIEWIDLEEDTLKTKEGKYCSPYHCCDPAKPVTHSRWRKWVKKHPDEYKKFIREINEIQYGKESK